VHYTANLEESGRPARIPKAPAITVCKK